MEICNPYIFVLSFSRSHRDISSRSSNLINKMKGNKKKVNMLNSQFAKLKQIKE